MNQSLAPVREPKWTELLLLEETKEQALNDWMNDVYTLVKQHQSLSSLDEPPDWNDLADICAEHGLRLPFIADSRILDAWKEALHELRLQRRRTLLGFRRDQTEVTESSIRVFVDSLDEETKLHILPHLREWSGTIDYKSAWNRLAAERWHREQEQLAKKRASRTG